MSDPRRIGPYEAFRSSELVTGVIVGRTAYFHPDSPRIVTGSPCCSTVVLLNLEVFRHAIEANARGFDSYRGEVERRCSGCGARFRLYPADPVTGARIETIGKLELRQFCIDWIVLPD